MPHEEPKSQANIARAMKQKLESLRGAGVSHIPKARPKAADQKAGKTDCQSLLQKAPLAAVQAPSQALQLPSPTPEIPATAR